MNYLVSLTLLGGVCAAAGVATAGEPIQLSEIRSKGNGTEFVELTGPPGTMLDGLTFVVIGDDDPNFPNPPDDVGNIEGIVPLDGGIIPASGVFFIAENEAIEPDLVVDFGPFGLENSGQNSYLLVEGFTGTDLQDLDTDNDGRLDVEPWTGVLDAVGLVAEGDSGFPYGAWLGFADVGPDGDFTPAHIYRCGLGGPWLVGDFGSDLNDTPGEVNPCPSVELAVSKSGPGTAISGNEIVYTLTVDNGGIDAAADVSIVDVLPAGTTFVSETSPPEVELVDGVGPELEWSIASLPGQSGDIVIELTVLVAEDATGSLTNTVEVSTSTPGDDPADNTDEVTTVTSPIVDPPAGLVINEIRVDQLGTDNDEYFELRGEPGTSLDGLAYVVLGDGGGGGSGVVEAVVALTGGTLGGSGLFVAAEASTFTLIPPFLLSLDADLNFENSDNVTHLLVANFSGAPGDDLDTDDDGVIDVTPWTDLLDGVGIVESPDDPPTGTEYVYGSSLGFTDVGPAFQPNGVFAPSHVYRCTPEGIWRIGTFDLMDPAVADSPATENPECPGVMLSVSKAGPETAAIGGMVTYTLTVMNTGFDAADDVTITDTLPDGLSFVSETSPAEVTLDDSTEPDIIWSVASVGARQSIEIELVALVGKSAGDEIVNTVEVTTSNKEDDPADNTDTALTTIVGAPPVVVISEIRADQPGGDDDEYVELRGEPGASLDGLTYLALGDTTGGGSGVIESITSLTGSVIQPSGFFVVAESTFTLGVANRTANLNFENSDNVTHLLVSNFTGENVQDLDTDDDGTLDVMPWSSVLDAVGLVLEDPPVDTEFAYGVSLGFEDVGPDQCIFRPAHVYRCTPDDTWTIGVFDFDVDDDGVVDPEATDTPGAANPECPKDKKNTCPADTDGNGFVDVDDLVAVILGWGGDGGDTNTDINGDCIVNVDDLVGVILAWGECP